MSLMHFGQCYTYINTKIYPAAFKTSGTVTRTWKSNLGSFWLFRWYYFHYYP